MEDNFYKPHGEALFSNSLHNIREHLEEPPLIVGAPNTVVPCCPGDLGRTNSNSLDLSILESNIYIYIYICMSI